jgi:hypothetical protein
MRHFPRSRRAAHAHTHTHARARARLDACVHQPVKQGSALCAYSAVFVLAHRRAATEAGIQLRCLIWGTGLVHLRGSVCKKSLSACRVQRIRAISIAVRNIGRQALQSLSCQQQSRLMEDSEVNQKGVGGGHEIMTAKLDQFLSTMCIPEVIFLGI